MTNQQCFELVNYFNNFKFSVQRETFTRNEQLRMSVYTYGWSVWTLSGLLKFNRHEIIIQYPFNKIFKHQNDWDAINTQQNWAANSWFYWFNEYYSLNNNNYYYYEIEGVAYRLIIESILFWTFAFWTSVGCIYLNFHWFMQCSTLHTLHTAQHAL